MHFYKIWVLYRLTSMKFKNPNTETKEQIIDDYEKLNDDLAAAFRNLEDGL